MAASPDSPPTQRCVAVLGAGSWGTALAISLAEDGHDVRLWARREALARELNATRKNATYLPEGRLPDSVVIDSDAERIVEGAEMLVFATPSQALRQVALRVRRFGREDLVLVSVAKGIENGTLKTMSQVLDEVFERVPAGQIGALSGPSHAEELVAGLPTLVVAACRNPQVARTIQSVFMTSRLRVYVNTDLIGVEIAGAVKNIMAIAAGIIDGVGFGDNARAALITRGIAEMSRLGLSMGARPSTFAGLTGIGDLVVTCTSRYSRNRKLGEAIGRGRTLEEIEKEMQMVAEGVRTTLSVVELAREYEVEMPITQAVHDILFRGKPPRQAAEELMNRAPKSELLQADVLRQLGF